jgi:hypothetical protein
VTGPGLRPARAVPWSPASCSPPGSLWAARRRRLGAAKGERVHRPRPWPPTAASARTPRGGGPDAPPGAGRRLWPPAWRAATPRRVRGASGAAATGLPRVAGSVRASGAQLQRGRHPPSARGGALSRASRDRRRVGPSTVVRTAGRSRPGSSGSRPRLPACYARPGRYTRAREPHSTAAMAVGLRPAAHHNTLWRARRSPYRARRRTVSSWACSSAGMSTQGRFGLAGSPR